MPRRLYATPMLIACGLAAAASAADPVPPAPGMTTAPPTGVSTIPYAEPFIYEPPPQQVDPPLVNPMFPHIRQLMADHRREPSGVPHPIGAGNAYTSFKFVFGSSRQFFGTAEASEGVWWHTQNPAPYERPVSNK